jgi:hypothetical protein
LRKKRKHREERGNVKGQRSKSPNAELGLKIKWMEDLRDCKK